MKGILEKVKRFFIILTLVIVETVKRFLRENGTQAAAAFSFFAFLSIMALMILLGAVLGMVLSGNQRLLNQIMQYITENVPGISGTIEDALKSSIDLKGVLGVVGILGLLYTGTKVFDSFQIWLNQIWGLERPEYLKKKLKSLLTLLFLGVVGITGFGLHVALFTASKHLDFIGTFMSIMVFCLTVFILIIGLMFIYSFSIEIKLGWRRVWAGALFAALLLNPAQMLLSWYYTNYGDFTTIYGSFAGVLLTIMAIYYSGYIIYLGATLNRVLDPETPDGVSP